ncbi:iron-containing alcohol dehydrogenase [Pseudohalioglobus lutimaris]|uniref:Alcohol dehydrogenase n=1 Tax=Pseudohalioglobus lutimaris TaxID=1737061 RepID=A0A2N5X0F5_9GAMM|nr:iron-containing alcohol dehydrogenase [Pseudohalioglobus lutimaris]PLW67962.1 alcohol dehydrogenase [Pseudohalioglobus lutimaris]
MQGFEFSTVGRIVSGFGSALELSEECRRLGVRSPLLVTDPGLVSIGLVQPVIEALAAAGTHVTLFDAVREDPPEATVLAAAELGRVQGVDGVIAVGGGSSLDVAKVVSVLLGGNQPLAELYGVDQVSGPRLPLVLVPTTAGTGSEATPVAVVTTGETTKAGVSSSVLLPDVAVLDAGLTLGLPPAITAMTGVDAMVHAIEAYTSRHRKNPLSDNLARQALSLLAANIRSAVSDGNNREARENMLLGACLAGQAFANAPVAAVHALAYPLGGHYHIPHGLSNSLVLPSVLSFNADSAAPLYAELAELVVGRPVPGSEEAATAALIAALIELIDELGLPSTLSEAGVAERDLEMLAQDAMLQQRLLVNNPRDVAYEDALGIYRSAYGEVR